jgi:hypothetical protein
MLSSEMMISAATAPQIRVKGLTSAVRTFYINFLLKCLEFQMLKSAPAERSDSSGIFCLLVLIE